MRIDAEIAAFVASPVMIILGTCDAQGRSDIGRGVGARVHAEAGTIEIVLSGWQWPGTAANIRATARAAITFARPTDYVCYQVKGGASVVDPDAAAFALADRYIDDIAAVLGRLGLERHIIAGWLTRQDAVMVRLQVESIFVQTPGARAGQLIARSA